MALLKPQHWGWLHREEGGPIHFGGRAQQTQRGRMEDDFIQVKTYARDSGKVSFCIWLCLAVFLVTTAFTQAASEAPRDSDVKAVYLLRFAEYVDWPNEAFPTAESPIVIGVFGDPAVQQALESIVQGERVRNRTFTVRTLNRAEDAKACHILFIGRGQSDLVNQLLTTLEGVPVLTTSDFDRFVDRGGMIRFVHESGKIRLHINLDATRGAHLVVSSRLLRVAEVVRDSRRQR